MMRTSTTDLPQQSLNNGIDIGNILSEVCLVLLPATLMPKVRTIWTIRLLVIACFASRLVVILTLSGHMLESHNFGDWLSPTWAYTKPTLWSQCTMNSAIVTACVPGMQQVLRNLRPGMTAMTVTAAHQDPRNTSGGSMFGVNSERDHPLRILPSKANIIFGSRTERAQTDCYRSGGKHEEVSRSDERKAFRRERRNEDESESVKGLTKRDIIVTREVTCSAEG